MNKFLKFLSVSSMLLMGGYVSAQHQVLAKVSDETEKAHLFLEMNDGTAIYELITNDMKLVPSTDEIFNIISSDDKVRSSFDVSELNVFGIIYKVYTPPTTPDPDPDPDPDPEGGDGGGESSVTNPITESNQPWSIADINGVVVARGESGCPDFSNLKSRQTYIITVGTQSYKFLNLK